MTITVLPINSFVINTNTNIYIYVFNKRNEKHAID